MKNLIYSLCLFICFIGFSQKQQKYSKAKITYGTAQNFQKLVDLGIPMDHGQQKKGVYLISDFSEREIALIKNAGIKVEILVDDVVEDFIQRNKKAKQQLEAKNLNCASNSGSAVTYPTPSNFSLGSMGGYFTYQEMLDNLDAMRSQYPNLISARADIGTFVTNGTPDNSVTPSIGGNALQWVRISDNPDSDEAEPEILYDAIHHAREPASLSQLIYYMWYLLENYNTDPEIKEIIDTTELYFVPVVNPDGYLYNQKTNPNGGGMWRKNRYNTYGVDLNRNYDYYTTADDPSTSVWGGAGTSSSTSSDVYPGTGPFSEPETQAMKWFTEQHDFIIALNNHTSGDLLLYPFGYASNTPTPDNATYEAISDQMVNQNGFDNILSAGLYPAAGDSDDFMYAGTTSSHNKIFAFTPEIGPEFWPASNQIDGICKSMMYLNLTAAKMTHNYAAVQSNTSQYVGDNLSVIVPYTITRLGLEGSGDFTVSIIPVSSNISSVGSSKNHNGLTIGNSTSDNITINLSPSIAVGDEISYTVQVDGGTFKESITINRTFGSLIAAVSDNCNSISSFTNSGWATTTSTFVSSSASITESPTGNYSSNQSKSIELTDSIDLTNANAANVQFYAKWDIENNWDYTQFEVSVDNGSSWIPQCGKYTNAGSNNAGQPTDEPLYDGTQSDWVLEEIDLSDYLGQSIKVRFQFASDSSEERDGFYFDDLTINTFDASLSNADFIKSSFSILPNPIKDILKIQPKNSQNFDVTLVNIQGQQILSKTNLKGDQNIDTTPLNLGIYFLSIRTEQGTSTFKIMKK